MLRATGHARMVNVRAAQRAPRDGRAHQAGPTYAPNEYFLSVENKI